MVYSRYGTPFFKFFYFYFSDLNRLAVRVLLDAELSGGQEGCPEKNLHDADPPQSHLVDHQAEEDHPDRKHDRRRKSDSSSSPGEDSDSDIQTLDDEDQGKKEDSRGEKEYGLDVDDVGSDEEDKYEDDDDIASIQSEPSAMVGFYPFFF
jgi:hypothetical protein